jgi:hypothetical protein
VECRHRLHADQVAAHFLVDRDRGQDVSLLVDGVEMVPRQSSSANQCAGSETGSFEVAMGSSSASVVPGCLQRGHRAAAESARPAHLDATALPHGRHDVLHLAATVTSTAHGEMARP